MVTCNCKKLSSKEPSCKEYNCKKSSGKDDGKDNDKKSDGKAFDGKASYAEFDAQGKSASQNKLSTRMDVIKTSLSTLGLASLGTLALVGMHHLGRKQYNAKARLSDYSDGVIATYKKLITSIHAAIDTPIDTSIDVDNTDSTDDIESTHTANADGVNVTHWVSGVADLNTNDFAVVGINASRHITWQTSMPERVHDILVQPLPIKALSSKQVPSKTEVSSHVAVMGRRPSEKFWILNSLTGEVLYAIEANAHRHFYGHACYSLDGTTLYVTENNTQTFAGMVGVYDVATGYKKIAEFESYGIGPHELVMHPDGHTLIVANGGIKTEKASREELNLDSMQPSLVYLNRHDGMLFEQIYPKHNQMSVRHLAIHDDGTLIVGIQFQGERYLNVPLVLTHQRGESVFTELTIADNVGWHRFHQYIASVAVDSKSNLLCVTSPIGGCAAVFDLTTHKMIAEVELPDCAGVAVWSNSPENSDVANNDVNNSDVANNESVTSDTVLASFLVSDGQGYLTKISVRADLSHAKMYQVEVHKIQQSFAFDNHLKPL